ncbi:MAG TPA: hypothetical protein PLN63_08425 [Paludibacteraceae bacterium]|nr:hypothetical protein [Paludibacteraceae bacterium]HOU69278.1 hypothetical protein [Paludibacteraceae bacterium]HPH63625.1 hypothetical protein [Paludibacteraceae bacterium]HQF51031.1 hypothetical protein [Paludibacteraceae bacterium]HQJ89780.1 hypothetical protein [Paludibacteraceae bacterium]
MKKINLFTLMVLFSIFSLGFVSCDDDDDDTDTSKVSGTLGDYSNVEAEYYLVTNLDSLKPDPVSPSKILGNVNVSGSDKKIMFTFENGAVFTGINVVETGNGFVFDIQSTNDMSGYVVYTKQGMPYSGAYYSSEKRYVLYIQYEISNLELYKGGVTKFEIKK